MLKLVVKNLEEVEDAFRSLYKQGGDGKFYLDTEEDEDGKSRLKEFRENNIKLMKEKEDLEKKLKDLGDPKEIAEMKKKIQLIEDKKMIEAGKIDELVAQKVERMRADFENQLNALKTAVDVKQSELDKTNSRLSEVLIDSEITKAVTAIGGVRKDAMQDIIARGKRVWRLEEGKPVPKEGDKILFGKDGKNPMTFLEWAGVLFETAPFLFENSGGSGAMGGQKKTDLTKVDLSKVPPVERLRMIHNNEVSATGKG